VDNRRSKTANFKGFIKPSTRQTDSMYIHLPAIYNRTSTGFATVYLKENPLTSHRITSHITNSIAQLII
jgi:hypothetical protein